MGRTKSSKVLLMTKLLTKKETKMDKEKVAEEIVKNSIEVDEKFVDEFTGEAFNMAKEHLECLSKLESDSWNKAKPYKNKGG